MEWDTPLSSPLSAFTAVPNPQMLAFMGTQSFIMMYQAGEGWQYGKRKQSAMSNEEFNKQTPLSIMDRQRQELINALPSIANSMNAMTPLIKTIVTQYGDFISEALKATPELVKNASGGLPFFAYGDTGAQTQKQFQSTNDVDWVKVLTGLTSAILGMGGRVPGKNPNPETEEERIANDKLIQQQTTKLTTEEHVKIREQNKFGNIVPPREKVPVISLPSVKITGSFEVAQYQNTVFSYQDKIRIEQAKIVSINKQKPQTSAFGKLQYTKAIKGYNAAILNLRKRMQSFIQISRNNNVLKSKANNDWNARIWNK